MKKQIFPILVSTFVVVSTFVACNKQQNSNIIEENKMQTISPMGHTNSDDPTQSLNLRVVLSADDMEGMSNILAGPIADLWSKKSGCKKIGICKWFPKVFEPTDPYDVMLLTGRNGVLTPIIVDENTQQIKPIVLAFTSDPSFLSEDDKQFYIDEDFAIDVIPEMNLPFQNIVIQSSIIDFDETIGNFGGYTINVTAN